MDWLSSTPLRYWRVNWLICTGYIASLWGDDSDDVQAISQFRLNNTENTTALTTLIKAYNV